MDLRKDTSAELRIYCTKCGNYANEYNWTLETAAARSIGDKRLPTLAAVLLRILDGDSISSIDYVAFCPRCHEKVLLRQIPLPSREELLQYVAAAGQDYLKSLF